MSLGGASVVVGKYILHLPIFFAQTVCLFFAMLFIVPLALIKEGRPRFLDIKKKDYLLMLLQGGSGVLMFRVFLMLALRYAPASSTGIVLSTTPAVLALFSVIFLKEKMSVKTITAVIICFAGMSLLNADLKNIAFKMDICVLLGTIFALMSVCSESLFTVFRKKQSYSDKPLTSTAIVMFFAFVLFLPLGTVQLTAGNVVALLSAEDFIYMFIYGAVCSSVAYALWFSGLAKVEIHEAAGFSGFMPLSSVTLSVIFLKEKITVGHIIGMALVLAGIYIITLKKRIRSENGEIETI